MLVLFLLYMNENHNFFEHFGENRWQRWQTTAFKILEILCHVFKCNVVDIIVIATPSQVVNCEILAREFGSWCKVLLGELCLL